MVKLFEMTAFLSLTMLSACGPMELPHKHFECQDWSQLYSHTNLYCDGEVVDSFIVCNPRTPPAEERENCIKIKYDLMERAEQDCLMQHVCYEEDNQ